MNSGFKLAIILVLSFSIFSCGHRKSPTGGEVDKEKPTVVAVTPEAFSELDQNVVEITFSKPIDRSSVYSGDGGIYIYPLIEEKRYRWSDNTLRIEFEEMLYPFTNYYLTVSRSIRDLRNNQLDNDYLFVFHTGMLATNRIAGNIKTELEEDVGEEVTIAVLSADSVRVFSKKVSGTRYSIEYLNDASHIIRAFIDTNNNNRYERDRDPFDQHEVPPGRFHEVDIYLEYFDDTKPEIRSVNVPFRNQVLVNMNKPIVTVAEIQIVSEDSLQTELEVLNYDFINNQIEIITEPMDSLRYKLTLRGIEDGKDNYAEERVHEFPASMLEDEQLLRIDSHVPRNGAVVENLQPVIKVRFSKHITTEFISFSLIDSVTNAEIPVEIRRLDSRTIAFTPHERLTGRRSYRLIIEEESHDYSGNELEEQLELNFLPIAEQ